MPSSAISLVLPVILFFAGTLSQAQKIPLKVSDPVLSQFEDGPALGSQKVVPGESVFFRFGAAGFKSSDSGKVLLTGHVHVFDPNGKAIAPPDENAIAASLNQEDKNWKPRLHFQFLVPSIAPGGRYHVKFDLIDNQTQETAAGETAFQVDGRILPPATELTVRDLAFYRGQDDEVPLRQAAYRPGDALWMKFEVTGYKYGEQNAVDVAYDVAVFAPDSRQLFLQENAAVEKSQAFYPQPWVPGLFSLTLQASMHPGIYTVAITARDGVGNSTVTEKTSFRVE